MGEIYAQKLRIEAAEVAQAIREHYMPTVRMESSNFCTWRFTCGCEDKLDTFLSLQLLECFNRVQTTHTRFVVQAMGTCTNSRGLCLRH